MAGQALPAGFIPDGVAAPAAAAAAPAGFVPDGFVPDFKSANDPVQATELAAKQRAADAAAAEAAKPGWIDLAAEAVKGWWSGMNPLPLLKSMYDGAESHFSAAEAAAKRGDYRAWLGENLHHAISPGETLVAGTIDAQRQQFQKAKKAYDQGRYSEAAAYTAAGVTPFVGPLMAKAGEDIGTGDPRQMARGFGEGVAAVRPQAGLELAGKVVRGAAGVGSAVARDVVGGAKLNPLEEASNAFAEEHGVPLDAATATGSKWARAAQKRVANSMGGEAPATEMIAAQREALGRTGAKLADQVNGPGQTLAERAASEGLYLHGSSADFDAFKQGGHGAIYLSPVETHPNAPGKPFRRTQAEAIAGGPFGGNLYAVAVDDAKLKKFDPLNDPKAQEIYTKVIGEPSRTGMMPYPEMPAIVKEAQKYGYNDFRVREPAVQGESRAITEPSALRIVEKAKGSDGFVSNVNKPGPATKPIDAGEGVQGSIRSLITTLHDQASKAYGKLREAEAAPENADRVATPDDPIVAKAQQTRQQSSIGYVPDAAAVSELRRIKAEMEAYGFEGHTWIDQSDVPGPKRGNAAGGQYEIVSGHAGAPVYDDILQASPGSGGTSYSRADVIRAIDSALETGHYTNVAKGALSVAERRAKGQMGGLSKPMLRPGAGDVEGATQLEGLSVDLSSVKKALAPIRDRMAAGANIAPLMGAKAEAFRALSRIVEGPDHAPLSVVDEALSDLKAMARGGKNGPALPELRSAGQGTAAYAVQRLEAQVRARAAQAGPHVLQALEEGRAMTREKATTGQLFETLREEPVQAFEQLTAPADKGVRLLEKIRDVAPMQMQEVGRAWLEKQLDLANQEGGFGHADKMWSNWNALGKQTKQILFSGAGQTQALDRFFLLAKRIAENPNPSGTAHTLTALNVGSAPVMNLLAKMLYTKQGVDAISRWMSADVPTRGASAGAGAGRGARAAAWMGVRAAAAKAGLQLPAVQPALAADADEQR